jgi:hypothetical protein
VVFGEAEGRQAMTFYRCLARRLASQGFDRIDTSIYQPSRILRLPNSIHSRTSLYKFPLEHAELITLDVHAIRQMARRPRDHDSMTTAAHEAPKAVNWWHRVEDWYAGRRNRQTVARDGGIFQGQGWQYPPCVRKAERATPQDGKRHETLLTLARFFALIDMAPAEIAHRLHEINARNPIRDTDYIDRVARDARRYRGFKGCPNDTLAAFCEPQACFLCQRRTQIVNRRKTPARTPPPGLSGPRSPDAPSQPQDHRIRGATPKGLADGSP